MKLKNWELVKELAVGRWSSIYTARPRSVSADHADYIIKFVDPSSDHFEMSVEMLRRELACSQLTGHPGIIAFLDHDIEEQVPFLVSARFQGDSLREINQRQKYFIPLNEKLMFFRQICEATRELHRLKIRHGDLSPGNVLIDLVQGSAKLIDLGLASKVGDFCNGENYQTGTPAYMAPECRQVHQPMATSSDVYSLGKSMIEFFEGKPDVPLSMKLGAGQLGSRLESLLESMTRAKPLKRPANEEVHGLVCELEISGLEGLVNRAA
ncbi:MAG: protein kinase [Planctomycetota bacterium]|nr:protein kinase [Planctomycetota bacterium]